MKNQPSRPFSTWSLDTHNTRCLSDDRSTLEFEDCGPRDLTIEEESYALPPEACIAQDKLFKEIRFNRVIGTTSLLSADELQLLCIYSPIQFSSVQTNPTSLTDLEKPDPLTAFAIAMKVFEADPEKFPIEEISGGGTGMLVEGGIFLKWSLSLLRDIGKTKVFLEENWPQNEAKFRALFWEKYVFKDCTRLDAGSGEPERVIRISKHRLLTVAVTKKMDVDPPKVRLQGSRKHKICPNGVLAYYPFDILEPENNSSGSIDISFIELNVKNHYVWFDLGYAVEAQRTWKNFSSQEERLKRLPVNRMLWNTSSKGKRISVPHYLNLIIIEIKALRDEDPDDLKRTTIAKLVMNASACFHDYMKLLWLGAPPKIHGPSPLHACSAFNEKDNMEGTVRYEAVELMSFDLTDSEQLFQFCRQYESIQSLAQHYAAQHKNAIEMAMQSGRDVALTELPGLRFLQLKKKEKLYFQMVDSTSHRVYEGPPKRSTTEPKPATIEYNIQLCPLPKIDEAEEEEPDENTGVTGDASTPATNPPQDDVKAENA